MVCMYILRTTHMEVTYYYSLKASYSSSLRMQAAGPGGGPSIFEF